MPFKALTQPGPWAPYVLTQGEAMGKLLIRCWLILTHVPADPMVKAHKEPWCVGFSDCSGYSPAFGDGKTLSRGSGNRINQSVHAMKCPLQSPASPSPAVPCVLEAAAGCDSQEEAPSPPVRSAKDAMEARAQQRRQAGE